MWEGEQDRRFAGLACIGRILAVDCDTRLCRVQTIGVPGLTDDLDIRDAKLLHNAWHSQGDEEVFFPRIGSYCVIIFANNQPYIVGYDATAFEDGKANAGGDDNIEGFQPGDKTIATIAGNRLTLRSGGAVTLESTKFCRTYWLPSKNIINSVCENYELEVNGGYWFWDTPEEETDLPDGSTRSDMFVWDNVLEPTEAVRTQMGTIEAEESTSEETFIYRVDIGVLNSDLDIDPEQRGYRDSRTADGVKIEEIAKKSIRVFGTTEDGYQEQYDAENKQYSILTPSGHSLVFNDTDEDSSIALSHSSGSQFIFDADGNFTLNDLNKNSIKSTEDTLTVTDANGNVMLLNEDGLTFSHSSGAATITIVDGKVSVLVKETLNVQAETINLAGNTVFVGAKADSGDFAVLYNKLKDLFDQHMHPTAMGPSGPPMPPDTFSISENIPSKSCKASSVPLKGNT